MKIPPREKIHEALTAIADKRIIINDNQAKVSSSDGKKEYLVEWNENKYSSNDNATYWQLYPGYPIIAVLLLQNKIDYNPDILKYFKEICWKELNEKFKNNYKEAVNTAFKDLTIDERTLIEKEISKIYDALEEINLIILRSKVQPPK